MRGSGRFRKDTETFINLTDRVSIPFIAGQWSLPEGHPYAYDLIKVCLNPLHCGAVVASRRLHDRRGLAAPRLNPLHCGAVVASRVGKRPGPPGRQVSIPFIAGQWSLPGGAGATRSRKEGSQSPSLRGSGRFPSLSRTGRVPPSCLNPLHCGAVVASRRISVTTISLSPSQSPSLRGSGRFLSDGVKERLRKASLNPLHCGAVVASRWRCGGRRSPICCLNPLHCGAVVASRRGARATPSAGPVSIPFIAGQWSLHAMVQALLAAEAESQSPSLRGSGRFKEMSATADEAARESQSPSLRGSGRFVIGEILSSMRKKVSIPFIAGQWSLRSPPATSCRGRTSSQSPSLRGSGRFRIHPSRSRNPPLVSIPFIAGQWSLLPRTTPSSLFGVLLRKRRLPCDHIICTRLPF